MPTVGGIVVPTGGAPATGRRTLLDIMTEIARPVDASDSTVLALAADAFRAAVRRMNRKGSWPWEYQTEDITRWISHRTLGKAQAYQSAVHNLEIGSTRITARVQGTQRAPYAVEVDFFRDLAGSRFMALAEQAARELKVSFDTLAGLFDKVILEVENLPSAADDFQLHVRAALDALDDPDGALATAVEHATATALESVANVAPRHSPSPIRTCPQERETGRRGHEWFLREGQNVDTFTFQ